MPGMTSSELGEKRSQREVGNDVCPAPGWMMCSRRERGGRESRKTSSPWRSRQYFSLVNVYVRKRGGERQAR